MNPEQQLFESPAQGSQRLLGSGEAPSKHRPVETQTVLKHKSRLLPWPRKGTRCG